MFEKLTYNSVIKVIFECQNVSEKNCPQIMSSKDNLFFKFSLIWIKKLLFLYLNNGSSLK